MFNSQLYTDLEQFIQQKDWIKLKEAFLDTPPADIAELLDELDGDNALVIFRLLKKNKAADVFSEMSTSNQEILLELFTKQQLTDLMGDLEPDERVSVIEELPGHLTQRLMNSLTIEDRKVVQKQLGYPEESIGRLMTPRYVRIKQNWTVERSMAHIRKWGTNVETINVIYVVDGSEKLIDDLRLNQLIMAEPEQIIEELMDHSFVALSAFDDQEEAVIALSKYDRVAMPVVDTASILIGIVTIDDVIDIAEEEATEDMQKMAGMDALDDYYSDTSVVEMVKKRIRWLIVLFVGQILTVTAMSNYEATLQKLAFLSFFIPLIISSGGNSGSQAATLIIRAISTQDILKTDWAYVLKRESLSGILLGVLIGILGFIVIGIYYLKYPDVLGVGFLQIASTISLSLICVVLWGNLCGSMLPFILSKAGFDPAVSSAPFVSTLVDVTGIVIYFSIANLILNTF